VSTIAKTMAELATDPSGAAVLKSADVTGFERVTDKDFDPVRAAVKAAIGEEY
jgi:hypothetical protein